MLPPSRELGTSPTPNRRTVTEPGLRLRVRDTLTQRKVRLAPRAGTGRQTITLYVCGVTPYDSGHMGHAFTFSMFDVLVRFIESSGVRVRYVQNVTDIDDPLFERARRDGEDWRLLAERETEVHIRDMTALGWRPPDVMPRVSAEIGRIKQAASKLHASGYAYRTDALYFDVARYRGYGRLSHRTRRSMLRKLRDEGLLGTVGPDAKRDALDFPLWRGSAPDEPSWPSKFGPGRPGWHIECSAMAMRYLGEQIDIHGGGRDLQFSHHESERAQSESLTGKKPFAKAWMHTGLVRYEGRKMSKSLGNLVKVSQALTRAPAAAARLYLVSHRYQRDWEFEWEGLARYARLVDRARAVLKKSGGQPSPALIKEFNAALSDDLDTPRAVRALRLAIRSKDAAAARMMLGVLVGSASLT
jgi:L-cysteine:1D-myo-inositol 2-amino-2-deoxy-alpha-D-glucopyranoside ligase